MTHTKFLKNNLIKQLLTFLSLVIIFGACTKENNHPIEEAVLNDQEMTAILEGALSSATQGLVADINDAVYLGQLHTQKTRTGVCGEQSDSTINHSVDRPLLSADYTLSWDWAVNCNGNNLPTSINFNRQLIGQYESQRMKSDDQASGVWLLDGLLLSPIYKFSGTYNREGEQQSKVRDQNNFSSKLAITVSEIQIDKNSLEITTGAATFELSGNSNTGHNFHIDGSIAFLGSSAATITVNGESYNIDLD